MGRRQRKQKGTRRDRYRTHVYNTRVMLLTIAGFTNRIIIEHMAEHLENSQPLRAALLEATRELVRIANGEASESSDDDD